MRSDQLEKLLLQVPITFRVCLYPHFLSILHASDSDLEAANLLLDAVVAHPVMADADPALAAQLISSARAILNQ